MSSDEPLFLEVDDVLEIHATQLDVYGGGAGLRDQGLLESAVAQPRAGSARGRPQSRSAPSSSAPARSPPPGLAPLASRRTLAGLTVLRARHP